MYRLPSVSLYLQLYSYSYRNLYLWIYISRTGHLHGLGESLWVWMATACVGPRYVQYIHHHHPTPPRKTLFTSSCLSKTLSKQRANKHVKRLTSISLTSDVVCFSDFLSCYFSVALQGRFGHWRVYLYFTANSNRVTPPIFWGSWKIKDILLINTDNL